MGEQQSVGTIAEIWRFPVKSMAGERLQTAEITSDGVVGDRAYALVDEATGDVVSAKNVRHFPGVLACAAAFEEPPAAGRPAPAVEVRLPGGEVVSSKGGAADAALSRFFNRQVRLARAAPGEGAAAVGDRVIIDRRQRRYVEGLKMLGLATLAPAATFVDIFQMSVVTTSTLRRLGEVAPASSFDRRRFRMNVVLETAADGFAENGWTGRRLMLGDGVRLKVVVPDARCVMTTLAQGDLPEDQGVLRALEAHNQAEFLGKLYPCAGVYAVVEAAGVLGVGDPARLA